jgi:DNA-binding NarL/FixJ family response regulator
LLADLSGGEIRVVGCTDCGAEALELLRRCQPHVVILDVSAGGPDSMASIRQAKQHYPWIRVLGTSTSDDPKVAVAALRAGADGFIPKSSDPRGFDAALRSLAGGYCVLPDFILPELIGARRHHAVTDTLTGDEEQLWRLISAGFESREIAQRLSVSERTAKRRVALLLRRLEVNNRVQAAALAGQCGILKVVG